MFDPRVVSDPECFNPDRDVSRDLQFGGPFTTPQLKIMQEAITIGVFAVFSIVVLKERLRANDWIAFALVMAAVVVSQMGKR